MTVPAPWFDKAACRDQQPDLWFPVEDTRRGSAQAALAVCNGCPVKKDCLEWALEHKEYEGIWGATTASQRKKMLAGRPRKAKANLAPRWASNVPTHGVRAGYVAGCRCLRCTNANDEYEAIHNAMRKASA